MATNNIKISINVSGFLHCVFAFHAFLELLNFQNNYNETCFSVIYNEIKSELSAEPQKYFCSQLVTKLEILDMDYLDNG